MKLLKQSLPAFMALLFLSSCGLLINLFKVKNPKHAGKYPKFDKELILLGELTPIRENFDVVFYNLDIRIYPAEKKLGGWVEIRAKALQDLDSVQLDLDQPLAIEQLRLGTREGTSLNYKRTYRAVKVAFDQTIKKDQVFSLHIKYLGKPVVARRPPWDGGSVWKKDKQKNPWLGVVCESEGASTWFPCKDHTSDEPDSARMRFTIPDSELMVVSNGIFVGTEKKDQLQSFSWKTSYPINVYNITFYVGNFAKLEDSYTGINAKELKLSYYVLKPNAVIAAAHFKQVQGQLRIYEELYGEYPWYADGFKLVESPYAGQEHQSAIAYGNGYKNDLYGKDDYIILHEMGHEWFGNSVTAKDLADVWLQEGITTYGESLYLEKKYGQDIARDHLLFYQWSIKNKFPLVGPVGRRYFDYKDGDVYTKGAWIMHTLRNNINDDAVFFGLLKAFYEENKLITTDSKKFIATVNKHTGKNYDWFFNQYLYQNKVPIFEYGFFNDGELYYRWIDVSEDFTKLAVPVTCEGSNEITELYPTSRIQKIILSKGQSEKYWLKINNSKALFGTKYNKKLYDLFAEQK